jgi:hypothetical protein
MNRFLRASFVLVILLASALLAACSDDDDGNNSDASPTPFIAPDALTTAQAVALLDEIEGMVQDPNRAQVALAQVSDGQVQERSLHMLNGIDDVSGLDDVRNSLDSGDRVGAGEYLFNVVRDDAAPLNGADTGEIDEDILDQLDPLGTFDEDHSDGMVVSAVFRDSILKMMELWYGLLGVPPDDAAEGS